MSWFRSLGFREGFEVLQPLYKGYMGLGVSDAY